MYQKESVYNRYVDSQPGRDYHYKIADYLENQASLIHAWIYDVVVTLVWTCKSRQDSGERCPLCGWETLVQIQAASTTLQDLLNKAALEGTDPYALINSRDQDDIIEEIKASPALQTNLAVAQREILVEKRAREAYLFGGGLQRDNERDVRAWRELQARSATPCDEA